MPDISTIKNFSFPNIQTEWGGYVSSVDKTKVSPNVMVQGSKNIYKKLNGNLAIRPGQKRRGSVDTTLSACSSAFVWNTSWGQTRSMVVSNSRLYAVVDDVWYTLLSGLTQTRYVFDKWYSPTENKDLLLFVNGTTTMGQWSGGFSTLASGSWATGQVVMLSNTPTNAGSGYLVGDVLTISTGGTGATATVTSVGTGTILTVTVTNAGSGYAVGDQVAFRGGDFGNGALVTVATIGAGGTISTVTLVSGGIGYTATRDYATTTGGTGFGAVLNAATVSTSGSITGIQLTTPGSGYTTGTGKATTGGTGTSATLQILTIGQGSILKLDTTTTFIGDGFASSGTIINAGVSYTYQSIVGNYLVGIGTDPTAIVSGSGGLQAVTTFTNTPRFDFNTDFIKVINNRVYCGSYNSRVIYISSSSNFANFAVPATTVPGSPNVLVLDSNAVGIGVRQSNPHIGFGLGGWMIVTYPTHTNSAGVLVEQITPNIKPVAVGQAPYAHEFIDTVGDSLVYLAQDQQVRSFGDFNNLFTPGYPSFSQEIATELGDEDFTGGSLTCLGEFVYVTAPNTGRVYLYQTRNRVDNGGNVVAERLWHSPFVWNLTKVEDLNGTTIGFSNANPQIYDLWDTNQWYDDSPSDEQLPYDGILALGYRSNSSNQRQKLQSFDKNYTEGYITPNTSLQLTINYNYQGAESVLSQYVNSLQYPAEIFQLAVSSLGDSSLGDESLGSGGDESVTEALYKFKTINQFTLVNCFEYQPIYSSSETNAQWEILAQATNAEVEKEQLAGFIINQQ